MLASLSHPQTADPHHQYMYPSSSSSSTSFSSSYASPALSTPSGSSPNLNMADHHPSYLQGTLQEIVTLANREDVEMKPPIDETNVNYARFLVVDTNILLHRFEVLTQFVEDIERNGFPVIVIVPSVVVSELDGHKKNSAMAWFARRASSWLLAKIRERKHVKGQGRKETCNSATRWRPRDDEIPDEAMRKTMYNDSLILDCWLYFRQTNTPTFLCSNDTNLCIATASENMIVGFNGIESPGNMFFTLSEYGGSREIARHIYGDSVNLTLFNVLRGYRKEKTLGYHHYAAPPSRGKSTPQVHQQTYDEDDMMMEVDDEGPGGMTEKTEWKSELAINILHEEVIDYFSRLLVDLVGKVGGEEVRVHDAEDRNMSQHAVRRRHYTLWTVAECVEWLIRKARDPRREGGPVVIQQENPRLELFLLKHYKGVPGSKTGKDWSRQGWRVALNNLRKISTAWRDESIAESLAGLEPYVDHVFEM